MKNLNFNDEMCKKFIPRILVTTMLREKSESNRTYSRNIVPLDYSGGISIVSFLSDVRVLGTRSLTAARTFNHHLIFP